jgi:two-component system, response regulator
LITMETAHVDILLVEDSLDDAVLTLNALKKCGQVTNVLHLQSGEKALDFLFQNEALRPAPKLIVLDLKMPRIDGIELLRRIKGDKRTRVIPTIILTSSREEQDINRSYQLGANSYLVKPVDYTGFLDMMAEVITYWLGLNQSPCKYS